MPGYSYWVDYLRQQPDARGVTLANAHVGSTTSQDAKALGQAFVTTQSAFFDATYGRLSDPQFVEALYTNIGGNAGDAGGIRYWTSQLQGLRSEGLGTQAARAQIAGAFVQAMISYDIPANAASLSSSEFQAAVERQDSFKNKIAVSLAYANASGQTGGEILVPHSVTDAAYQAAIRAIDHVTFDVRTVNVAILGINNSVAHQDLSLIV